jgi:hypothetical protein
MSLPALIAPLKAAFGALGSLGSTLQAGLALGSTALNFTAQNQAAKAESAAIAAANEDARQQTISDYDQITRRGQQEKEAAGAKLFQTSLDRKKTVSRAEASASEGNIGGLSVTALLTDIYGQEARIRDGVNQNLEATKAELDTTAANTARSLKNTLATRPSVSKPSKFGALLEAGTGIYGAYKDDLRTSARVNRTTNLGTRK